MSPTLLSSEEAVSYLERVVPAMRRLGVRTFDGLELGPDPATPDAGDESERILTASEKERRARAERMRIALGASGGPVPRVERNT